MKANPNILGRLKYQLLIGMSILQLALYAHGDNGLGWIDGRWQVNTELSKSNTNSLDVPDDFWTSTELQQFRLRFADGMISTRMPDRFAEASYTYAPTEADNTVIIYLANGNTVRAIRNDSGFCMQLPLPADKTGPAMLFSLCLNRVSAPPD